MTSQSKECFGPHLRCPFCHGEVQSELEYLKACGVCKAPYHRSCILELKACVSCHEAWPADFADFQSHGDLAEVLGKSAVRRLKANLNSDFRMTEVSSAIDPDFRRVETHKLRALMLISQNRFLKAADCLRKASVIDLRRAQENRTEIDFQLVEMVHWTLENLKAESRIQRDMSDGVKARTISKQLDADLASLKFCGVSSIATLVLIIAIYAAIESSTAAILNIFFISTLLLLIICLTHLTLASLFNTWRLYRYRYFYSRNCIYIDDPRWPRKFKDIGQVNYFPSIDINAAVRQQFT